MSFEVDRYSSAWAHIALCADLTWATEPPDDFIIANQRLLAQHCRVSQVLQDTALGSLNSTSNNQCEISDKRPNTSQSQENGNYNVQRSVKEVIPESRLAQFYGNFYYDETREKCYTNANDKSNGRGYNGQGCETPDLTECWMLPEVEYWFRKLVDDTSERGVSLRRRRHCRMTADDDLSILQALLKTRSPLEILSVSLIVLKDEEDKLKVRVHAFGKRSKINGHQSAASERWGPSGARAAGEEAALAARVLSVRPLWAPAPPDAPRTPCPPSPPPTPRKMRARRRQPRRLTVLAPPPPAYCIDAPAQLLCDPTCKFQFDSPRPLQLADCQRAMGRLSASVQAVMRASAARCPPYRGTNVSRYAPTSQRPARGPERRYGVWWPRDHPSPRLDQRLHLTHALHSRTVAKKTEQKTEFEESDKKDSTPEQKKVDSGQQIALADELQTPPQKPEQPEESKIAHDEKVVVDEQMPSTSTAAMEIGLRKKRLYSTVLSMSAPTPINLAQVGCVRLPQKLVAPGLLKLNTKIILPAARLRPPVVDNKFEELEKEALEQYKASDESIDTKFHELEKQAVEQYSASNSNTSCSSGNSAEKRPSSSPSAPENDPKKKQPAKFHKEKAVDSVVIYSQNFPDLNAKANTNLKNFHTPLRGEKKEQAHRPSRVRNLKSDPQRAASDTDYEARDAKTYCKGNNHKGSMRWTLHVVPPKKRHLTFCVSDFSSDEEFDGGGSMRDAGPRMKSHVTSKMKMSAHGGGDLRPIMRKT